MKLKHGGLAALLLTLALAACTNMALNDSPEGSGNGGGKSNKGVKTEHFPVDAVAGLSVVDAMAGHRVARLTVPEREGPWTVELVSEVDHNHHFTLRLLEAENGDGEDSEDESEAAALAYEVVIAEEVTLEWGPYQISIRIYNTAGKEFFKTINFEVSETPAPFKRAPNVYPYIVTPGKNKLGVFWESVSGAEGYRVYLGTTSVQPQTAFETVTSGTTLEVTDIEGDNTVGGLPDGTLYYVWVEAYNDAGPSLSPSAQRKTSATVQPYWYEGVDKHDCLYGDWYKFTQTTIEYGPMGLEYTGEILYHSEWTEADAEAWPQATKGKHNEQFSGKPQGVFVIKYNQDGNAARAANNSKSVAERTKLYSAVYYWGMDVPAYHPDHADKRQAYAVNQWNNYAERTSFEEAIDYFTCANVRMFLKAAAEPYIRFMKQD